MTKVLVVDDEAAMRFVIRGVLESHGFDVVIAESAVDALKMLDDVDVVVSDYSMPEMDGMELLEKVRATHAALPFILVTSQGSERLAVRALMQGAYNYLRKPFDNDELFYTIERAAETRRLRLAERDRAFEAAVGVRIIGHSPALSRVLDAVSRVASKDVTVLIRGETGTGKELVASLLHANGQRANQQMVVFNCAAIPAELAEAQLFGYSRGAFTGAVSSHEGFFVQANGSTLFLDEIGELPLAVQAKLLRVLQEREVQPLGSTQLKRIDVRVIAATHRDLEAEVRAGRFRQDLYYRLNVVELTVPPLRERRSDIPLLAREFARKYSERFGLGYVIQLAPELIERLENQPWPGNIRELENSIARCVALANTQTVTEVPLTATESGESSEADGLGLSYREQVESFERSLIRQALRKSNNNQSEAARRLRVNRATFYDKLRKFGLLDE
jgi:two-component system response regulator AtoC